MTPPFVSDIRGCEIILQGVGMPLPTWLAEHSPQPLGGNAYKVITANESARNCLLATFRDNKVAFAGGLAGWPPSEIIAELRERGAFTGSFDEVVFAGGGRSMVRQR